MSLKILCQVMTRTSGYYANVSNMNPGKRSEVSERRKIKVPEVVLNEVSNKKVQM